MTWLYGIDDGKILYRTVFENIMRAGNWRAVVSGCTVSPGTGLSVNISSGVILYDDVFVNVSSTALSLGNALSDRDRLVAIVYDFSDSSLKVLDRQQWINVGGTYYPMAPVLTQNQVAIALVRIRQNASSISTDDIMDMRAMFNIGVDMVGLRRILKAPTRDSGNILSAMQNESDELVSFILFLADDSVSASILNSSQITDAKAITWAHGILQMSNMKFFKVMVNSNLGITRFNTILNDIYATGYLLGKIKELPKSEIFGSTIRNFYSRITNSSIRNDIMNWYDSLNWSSYTFSDLINLVTDGASDVTYGSNASVGYVIANNLTIGSGVTLTLGNGGFIVARNITNNGTVQGDTGFYVFVSGSASGGTYDAGAGGVGSMIRFNANDQCGLGGNGGGLTANCVYNCSAVTGGTGARNGGGGGARQEVCPCGCYACCCSYNGYNGGSVGYTLWSVNDLKKYMMKIWFTRLGWIGTPFPWIGGANGGPGPGAGGGAGGGEIIAVCYSISGTFRAKGANGGNSASGFNWINAGGGGGGGGMIYVFRNTGSLSINVSGGLAGSQTECVNGAPQNGGSGFYAIYGWY